MKLIVGLGNPGFLYSRNRHNIGFTCVRHLARMQGIRFDKKQGHARTDIGNIGQNRVVLARAREMGIKILSEKELLEKLNAIM